MKKFILFTIAILFLFIAMPVLSNQNGFDMGDQISSNILHPLDFQIEISKNQIDNTDNMFIQDFESIENLICISSYNLKNEIPNLKYWQNSFDLQ